MLNAALPRLMLAVMLPFAIAGCDPEHVAAATDAAAHAAEAVAQPPLGQELYRMFDTEKGNATLAELPAQF